MRHATRTAEAVENVLRGASSHDGIRHGVGMALVRVPRLTDATLQLHATTLLDDVRRLVSGGLEARSTGKCDVIAGRVRLGADRSARGVSRATDVSLDVIDIVAAEQALDRLAVRQRAPTVCHTGRGEPLDIALGATGRICRRRSRFCGPQLHRGKLVRRSGQSTVNERGLPGCPSSGMRRTDAA